MIFAFCSIVDIFNATNQYSVGPNEQMLLKDKKHVICKI
jgi:hypothetical protein